MSFAERFSGSIVRDYAGVAQNHPRYTYYDVDPKAHELTLVRQPFMTNSEWLEALRNWFSERDPDTQIMTESGDHLANVREMLTYLKT